MAFTFLEVIAAISTKSFKNEFAQILFDKLAIIIFFTKTTVFFFFFCLMANEEKDIEKEFAIAQHMKNVYCDKSGKEINPEKAAESIYQIGLIYKARSPDKVSLIKSVGLFNAAIIRNPSNKAQIKFDLYELCQHILQQAKAINWNANLIEKAEQIKYSINELRMDVKIFFQKSVPKLSVNATRKEFQKLLSKKISAIQRINKTIARKYKTIMADVSQFCEDVMGKPPCEYTIAGMGSLAREEITPYSDFEHVIILCNDKNCEGYLEYFRWFSVIFHSVILNLQETIIPSINVSSLNGRLENWYYDAITPRGISFDGMMPHACKFPLGRLQHTEKKPFTTELIKPVDKMLEYLSNEKDLKNGYHLADILTQTCFVFGNKNIFTEFEKGVRKFLDTKSHADKINDIRKQVKEDLNSFSTRFRLNKLDSEDTLNIKQLVYRSTTIFIAALARIHNISANSCFDVIKGMKMRQQITETTAHKLECAIAIACEMRLRVYMEKNSQCDNAITLKEDGIKKFLDIVGVACTINYFQIAYCLQREVARQLNFTKLHFYSNPKMMNFTIGLAFGITNFVTFSENSKQDRNWNSKNFEFDSCIEQLETDIQFNNSIGLLQWFGENVSKKVSTVFNKKTGQSKRKSSFSLNQIETIANYLFSVEIYDEAVEFYKKLSDVYHNQCKENICHCDVSWPIYQIGICLKELKQPKEGLKYLNQALKIKQNTTLNAKHDRNIATTLQSIGLCHIDLQNYEKALAYLQQGFEITQNTTLNAEKDKVIAATFHNIGRCHIYLQNHDDALKSFDQALEIYKNFTLNAEKDEGVASTLHDIGCCHIDLQNQSEALLYLHRALAISESTTLNAESDLKIAAMLDDIGRCLIHLHHCDDALNYLVRALEIKQRTTLNADEDGSISATLREIGLCHFNLQNHIDAKKYLSRAFQIDQKTISNVEQNKNLNVAIIKKLGRCCIYLHDYDDALRFLNQALKIEEITILSAENDSQIERTIHNIARCHINLYNYNEALKYLYRALDIYQRKTQDAKKDKSIALTLYDICQCHVELHNNVDALSYFSRALIINQNII